MTRFLTQRISFVQTAESLRRFHLRFANTFSTHVSAFCESVQKSRLSALDNLHSGVRRARTSDLYDVNVNEFVQCAQIYGNIKGVCLWTFNNLVP